MEQTPICQRGGGIEGWMKEDKEINQKHTYITHRHEQQCSDSQRESGEGLGGGREKGEKWGWKETLLGVVGT